MIKVINKIAHFTNWKREREPFIFSDSNVDITLRMIKLRS